MQEMSEREHAERSALALSTLGQSLISATIPREVASLIAEVADGLFGWDASAFYLFSEERDEIQPVRYADTVGGRKAEVPPPKGLGRPNRISRRIIEHGAELILRE